MKYYFLLLFFPCSLNAQELFSYTEPASNMAAGSIGLRLNNSLMDEGDRSVYHLNPELMLALSRKLMIHADVYFGNATGTGFKYDGVSLYGKFRFFSTDEVHSHFRVALYSRASSSSEEIHQPAIDLQGHNSGFEGGIVATKLINKVAVSASSSFIHANDNGSQKFHYGTSNRNALGYTFSLGKLLLPKEYKNYNQTNMNLMAEFLGQSNVGSGVSFLDLAPSLQFIFLSKMRLDLGYRFPLVNSLKRSAERGFLVRLEYNIFNAFK